MINGVFCHETGCPNSRKTWDADRQEWLRVVTCSHCEAEYFDCDTHECEPDESFDYEQRVRELEAEGLTRSDAQAVADVEENRKGRA